MLIGAEETTLLKLATAYAMLDNGGMRVTPTFIDRVQDRNGTTVYRADTRPCEGCSNVPWTGQAPPELADAHEEIEDPASAYQVVSMMEGVIERGTGHAAASLGRPLAGKTGTTNESNDTWFIGFSPDLLCGVFVGFDQPKSLGKRETGASVALPAWKEFMAAALEGTPAIPFRIPPGVEMVRVDLGTGKLASAGDRKSIYEPFKPGTEPTPGDAAIIVIDGAGRSDAPLWHRISRPPAHVRRFPPPGHPAGLDMPLAAPATGTGGLYILTGRTNFEELRHARRDRGGRRRYSSFAGVAEEASLTGITPRGAWPS